MLNLSPEARRCAIQYAARENITFNAAIECLIFEGVKAIAENSGRFAPVHKGVDNT